MRSIAHKKGFKLVTSLKHFQQLHLHLWFILPWNLWWPTKVMTSPPIVWTHFSICPHGSRATKVVIMTNNCFCSTMILGGGGNSISGLSPVVLNSLQNNFHAFVFLVVGIRIPFILCQDCCPHYGWKLWIYFSIINFATDLASLFFHEEIFGT